MAAGSGSHPPIDAVLLLATAVTVLAAASTVPVSAAAAADKYGGGRMVIIRAPGARVVVDVSAGGGALNNKWQQQQRRLVEDEVAPEFGGVLGLGNGGHISADALYKDRGICLPHAQCAAHGPGGSNTRPCTYKDYCPHTPTAGAGHDERAAHG